LRGLVQLATSTTDERNPDELSFLWRVNPSSLITDLGSLILESSDPES